MIDPNRVDGRERNIRQINQLALKQGFSVFIYGAGVYGSILREYLRNNGVMSDIGYVVDNDYVTANSEVIPIDDFIKEYSYRAVLILGIYDYPLIREFKQKYKDIIPHMYEFHLTVVLGRYLEWEKAFVFSHIESFKQTYLMLADEISKLTLQLYLETATGGDFGELYDDCYSSKPYFNELTDNLEIDTFIDCGAFDGDTVWDYMELYPAYKDIYAFEPDRKNVEIIRMKKRQENTKGLHVMPQCVHSQRGTFYFVSEGKSSSHLSEKGNTVVQATRLDDLIDIKYGGRMKSPEDRRILIKMDIEGCELEALKGAESLIRRYNPCLAVCVYHKEEDMIRIPQFINSLVPDKTYDYYLRFHGRDLAELVFYAVPKSYRNVEEE